MELPDTLLADVAWSFIGGVESDFESYRVSVMYKPHPFEDDKVVNLATNDGNGFSQGELLFKLHNAVVEDLDDRDHHFFEGLTLSDLPLADAPAVYVMRLGS